jgi:osmotically-inducible protein OsmY
MALPISPDPQSVDRPAFDEDLAARVRHSVSMRRSTASLPLCVKAIGGAIVIEGSVRTFYERQMALTGAMNVKGVRQVIDKICVETLT